MTEPTRRPRSVDLNGVPAVDAMYAATARLMEREAFADISVAHILTEANVSRATFYFYFSSKFSVLSGLLESAMEDIFETVQPFLERSPADRPPIALERSIRAVTQAWHRHRAVLQAANQHWHSEPSLRALWLAVVERFVAAGAIEIDREREAGLITSDLPSRTLAATLFWVPNGCCTSPVWASILSSPTRSRWSPLVTMWNGTLYGK